MESISSNLSQEILGPGPCVSVFCKGSWAQWLCTLTQLLSSWEAESIHSLEGRQYEYTTTQKQHDKEKKGYFRISQSTK